MSYVKEELFLQLVELKDHKISSKSDIEIFVINGIEFEARPDNPGKVSGRNNLWYRENKGFAGREFVIITNDGRRIVTHNLWMGESTDKPDNAHFDGREAKPVRVLTAGRFSNG